MKPKPGVDLTESKKSLSSETNFLVSNAIGNVFSDFLVDRDVSGVRPATLTFYKNELNLFLQWAGEAGAKTIDEIAPDLLRAYFLDLRKRRNRNGIAKMYSAVKTFLRWAWCEYDLPDPCPIVKVKVADPEINQQPAIELDDFSGLLAACEGPNRKRDIAVLLFLLDTGIRRAELCRLTIAALQKGGMVQLEADGTKTGERRKVFLTRETQKALKVYLAERGVMESKDPLFSTDEGSFFSPSGLRQVVRRRAAQAGIPEPGMHSFRRGYAIESLRAGADLVSVSRILGHRSIETTKRYLPQTDDDLRLVHDRTSPVNRLKNRN